MTYKDNTPTYNTNRKVANFGNFINNLGEEKEKMKKVQRSFQPNSDRQNFPANTRNEFDTVTRKITSFTKGEIDDKIESIDGLEEANEKKAEKFESIEECPSFSEFNKSISELKKLSKKIHSELKKGTKSEIDDYIEKKIFGRDV
jgi:protein-tyrosine phosphatase